jgi:hypothetical protein
VVVRSHTGIAVAGFAIASCNPGEVATGGGGSVSGGIISASKPDPTGGTPTGWRADGSDLGGSPATVTAYAVCASP